MLLFGGVNPVIMVLLLFSMDLDLLLILFLFNVSFVVFFGSKLLMMKFT